MRRTLVSGTVLAAVVIAAVGFAIVRFGDALADKEPVTVDRPRAGEVLPAYLSDRTPVWVIGHEDGSVDVLPAFDRHMPNGLGKLVWWCPAAGAFDNPEHGAKYDEYGIGIGGPAPEGMPRYAVSVLGNRVVVGEVGDPPPMGTPVREPAAEGEWCSDPAETVHHDFSGWQAWTSPTGALAAAPRGWILLAGSLVPDGDRVLLCSPTGCQDAAVATNVVLRRGDVRALEEIGGERFIARVAGGALVGVTRVLPWSGQ